MNEEITELANYFDSISLARGYAGSYEELAGHIIERLNRKPVPDEQVREKIAKLVWNKLCYSQDWEHGDESFKKPCYDDADQLLSLMPRKELKDRYNEWRLELITIIANSGLDDGLIREEIKVVCRENDAYKEPFDDGDTPEEAWQGELDAIQDSQ